MVVSKTLFLNKLTFFNQNNYQTIHLISNEAKKRSIEAKAGYIPYIRNKNGVFGLLSIDEVYYSELPIACGFLKQSHVIDSVIFERAQSFNFFL